MLALADPFILPRLLKRNSAMAVSFQACGHINNFSELEIGDHCGPWATPISRDLLNLILIWVGPVINKDGMKGGLSIVFNVNRAGGSEPPIKMMAWGPVYPVMPGERILYAFAQTFRRMIKGRRKIY